MRGESLIFRRNRKELRGLRWVGVQHDKEEANAAKKPIKG